MTDKPFLFQIESVHFLVTNMGIGPVVESVNVRNMNEGKYRASNLGYTNRSILIKM